MSKKRRTELAFKVLEFPKGRAEKGRDPRGRITPTKYCVEEAFTPRTRELLPSKLPTSGHLSEDETMGKHVSF